MYATRKHKGDISINMGLSKRRILLLKEAYSKAKYFACVDFSSLDVNCLLCLPLKNFDIFSEVYAKNLQFYW